MVSHSRGFRQDKRLTINLGFVAFVDYKEHENRITPGLNTASKAIFPEADCFREG